MLDVSDLTVSFAGETGVFRAVNRVSFSLKSGEITGIVGESGSGKSMTALALTGLAPADAVVGGAVTFMGKRLRHSHPEDWRGIRGKKIGTIFQEPGACLNPLIPVGRQVAEVLAAHGRTVKEAFSETEAIFARLGIHPPKKRMRQYPNELSGGLKQRVMIATAYCCRPELLIADEPTTALDLTIQAQILGVLRELTEESRMALLLISHDLGVIAQLAKRVLVMCGGRIVEEAAAVDFYREPCHPYSRLLLSSVPPLNRVMTFTPPAYIKDETAGCKFYQRCSERRADCRIVVPERKKYGGRTVCCHLY